MNETSIIKDSNKHTNYHEMLLPYYTQDSWNLTKHPLYENMDPVAKEKLGRCIIDFNLCRNPALRDEVKFYLQSKIEIEKISLRTAGGKRRELYNLFEFMEDVYPDVESVFDIDREQFRVSMVEYAAKHWNGEIFDTVYRVDKNMDWHAYTHIGRNLGQMYWLPEAIETFLKLKDPFNFNDDVWDIRKMPYRDKIPAYRPRYILTFLKIRQPIIKDNAKRFIYHKLAIRELSTCQDYLKAINLFCEFLWSRHYDITKLSQLTRPIIEEYLEFVLSQSTLCTRTQGYRVGKLREFFDTCILLDLPDQPPGRMILDSDYHTHTKPAPRFFTDEELRQFNQYAYKLPLTIARMLFVIESVGMRISELSGLQIGCVSIDNSGQSILTYYQYKTKKENRVPISKELQECIERESTDCIARFGDGAKYVFCSSTGNPVSVEVFQRYLNVLSKENNFVNRAGKPLRVKSHCFRATVATNYMNIGVDSNVIRMMIGQADIRSLQYYAEASEERVRYAMGPIIEQQERMIQGIGKTSTCAVFSSAEKLKPLCNGECMKKDDCDHFNACYSCSMFRPDVQHIALYRYQLQRAEECIALAKANEMTRLLELNMDLKNNLEHIIERCTKHE